MTPHVSNPTTPPAGPIAREALPFEDHHTKNCGAEVF